MTLTETFKVVACATSGATTGAIAFASSCLAIGATAVHGPDALGLFVIAPFAAIPGALAGGYAGYKVGQQAVAGKRAQAHSF